MFGEQLCVHQSRFLLMANSPLFLGHLLVWFNLIHKLDNHGYRWKQFQQLNQHGHELPTRYLGLSCSDTCNLTNTFTSTGGLITFLKKQTNLQWPVSTNAMNSRKAWRVFLHLSPLWQLLLTPQKIIPSPAGLVRRNNHRGLGTALRRRKRVKSSLLSLPSVGMHLRRHRKGRYCSLLPAAFWPMQLFHHTGPASLGIILLGVRRSCNNREEWSGVGGESIPCRHGRIQANDLDEPYFTESKPRIKSEKRLSKV